MSSIRASRRAVPVGFLLPAAIAVTAIIVIPAIVGTVLTFSDWAGFGTTRWVGLENYIRFFSDTQSLQAVRNTVVLTVIVVAGQNLVGLALALALRRSFRGQVVLQAVFLLPVIVSPVIISYLWQYLYSPFGAINTVLGAVGLDGLRRSWLGDPDTALGAIAVAIIWQSAGNAMVVYLAGLRGIPEEVLEASELDGASRWTRLITIMLPLLAPAITINLVLSVINALRTFDQIITMTNGGPGYATDTIASVIYKLGFGGNQLAYGLTMSLILTVAIALIASGQTVLLRRREEAMR